MNCFSNRSRRFAIPYEWTKISCILDPIRHSRISLNSFNKSRRTRIPFSFPKWVSYSLSHFQLLSLFTTMCERNYQYVERLCRLGILDILKSYLLHENTTVRENAVIFLTFIVQQYASPAKIFARSQQFENAIRQSLLGTDFVFVLFHMVSQPDLPLSLLTAVFSCLSQYTNEISLSGDECMETLVATNMWLSELLPSTHCLCFPSAASPSPDLDPLLIAICKTLSAHFTTLSRVMVDLSSL